MSYLILLKDESGKESRFLNVITEEEKQKMFIPENCRLVKEGEISSENLMKLPLVHDATAPLFFDLEEAPIKYNIDKQDSNMITSILLLVVGFEKRLAKHQDSFHMMKCMALQERIEQLHTEMKIHTKNLENFLYYEITRENPFILQSELLDDIEKLQKSKNRIMSITNDIRNLLGKSEQKVLHDF